MIGITKLRIFSALIVAMCLTVSACKTTSDLNPLLEKIPSNDEGVALIEDPNQMLIDTMRWLERALGPAGRTISERLRQEGRKVLGFDPVTSTLSEKLHLDNDVGLAIFSPTSQSENLLLAKSTKPAQLFETLHAWYRRIDTSAKMETRDVSGGKIKLQYYGKPFGKELVTVFIVRQLDNGWFLVGGADSETSLSSYAAPVLSKSLASTALAETIKTTPRPDIQIWAPPALLFGKSATPLNQSSRGVLSSIDITATGITLASEAPIELPSFLKAMETAPLRSLLNHATEEDFFVAATRLAQDSTLNALAAHPPWQTELINLLAQATEEAGLDIHKDVLPQLNGDVLITAALSPQANVASLRQLKTKQSLSKLGSQFKGRIYLGIKDTKAMQALLNKGLETLKSEGHPLRQRLTSDGYQVIEPDLDAPAFGWALGASYYVYALGVGELEAAIATLRETPSPNSIATQYGNEPNTSLGIVRLGTLAQSLKALSANAGIAPQLQGLVKPVLTALERIGDLAFKVQFTERSLRLTLTETLP